MVLQDSLMTFFSGDSNLPGFKIELERSNSMDALVFIPKLFTD